MTNLSAWTEEHYDFAGYVTGFDPGELGDRGELGYRDDERVCIVTVGGSGVGGHLLRRVIDAYPEAKERVPDLRMIVVAGPRHHFEQNFHVRHRLERCGAGRCMDFQTDGPAEIAAAIAEEIGREVDYQPVETDGAERAARLIAELI